MRKRRTLTRWIICLCGALACAGFIALGNWQLERRLWKLDLIEKVAQRVHAPAEAAPNVERWPTVHRETDEYRHVSVRGRFLLNSDTLVVAATELGSGYWVLTPVQRDNGSIVFVNRGFIGQDIEPAPTPTGDIQITGLLRLNEPGGSVLRDNNPAKGRWYSRDVSAMASARGFRAAPYFIDAAENQPGSGGGTEPVGGLTVIHFHNNHLVYALTWYSLATMLLGAGVIVLRESRRGEQQ